jgi:hypothetical protein
LGNQKWLPFFILQKIKRFCVIVRDKLQIMQAYYLTGSNLFTIRTQDMTSTPTLTLRLENMYTLVNTTSSISTYTFDNYENLLQFTASISGATVGAEYRARITSASTDIWNGSIQVYQSQSLNTTYTNQNNQYVSHITDNEFIIM